MRIEKLAWGLGLFSIALGLSELLFTRALGRATGTSAWPNVMRAFGARELAAGAMLLAGDKPAPGLWARVAGDTVDLAALGLALKHGAPRRPIMLNLGVVGGVTALDLYGAVQASRS